MLWKLGSDAKKNQVEVVGELPREEISSIEPSKDKNLVRVAAYCRVSKALDCQNESIEIQKKHFMSLIHNEPNWKLAGIYTDEGVSGTHITKRAGFQRMIRHCEEGKIDKILCKSISRFGRNTMDILNVICNLKEKNIGIFFEKENINTLAINSEFVLSTIAAIAQDESRSISENSKWSYIRRVQQGQPIFVRLLGYNVEKTAEGKTISINEEEAAIVKEIFDLTLQGINQTEIARIMMDKGYKTKNGESEWSRTTIKHILKNERYTGDVLCQKSYRDDFLSKAHENKGERQQYLIKDHHSGIISQEAFEKVQLQMSLNKKGVYKKRRSYPLSGRVICGECGAIYHFSANRSKFRNWMCSKSIKSHKLCNATSIRELQLENALQMAFKLKYDITSDSVIYRLKADISRVQENDNFENQRLNMYNRLSAVIKIEKSASGKKECAAKAKRREIEEKIKNLEHYWRYIEEDRTYRTKALDLLERLPRSDGNSEMVLQNLNIEFMRALAMTITVFSDGSYIIRWADDTETQVEDGRPRQKKKIHKERKDRVQELNNIEDGVMNPAFSSQAIKVRPHHPTSFKPITLSFPALNEYSADASELPQKRVCAYCRVSTNQKEQLSSFELQITHYTDVILRNPLWKFSGIYADQGASGTTVCRRLNFLRMIEDSKAGKIDLIITKSISRFARNTVDCLTYVRMLKTLPSPVGVYFERENINSLDDESDFMLIILSGLAQEESRSLSDSLSWGCQRRFEHGIVTLPKCILLGYDIDDQMNWKINEEEAKTVRRIYKEFLAGKPVKQIVKDLMSDGIKTGKGKTTWWFSSIYRILQNEKYCGDILLQKLITPHYLDHHKIRNNGQQTQYFIENHHEAIISKEDWNSVQLKFDRSRLEGNQKSDVKGENTHTNVFTKMIYCGICGNYFLRRRITSRGKQKYRYSIWTCRASAGHVPGFEWHIGNYREEEIEKAFMAMLLEMKRNQDFLIEETNMVLHNTALSEYEVERVNILNGKIKSLYKKLSQIGASAEKSVVPNNISDLILEASRENEALQSELEELDKKIQKRLIIESNLKWLLRELNIFKKVNPVVEPFDFRPDIFGRIVKRCVITNKNNILFELNIGMSREIQFAYISNWFRNNREIKKPNKRGI